MITRKTYLLVDRIYIIDSNELDFGCFFFYDFS